MSSTLYPMLSVAFQATRAADAKLQTSRQAEQACSAPPFSAAKELASSGP
ncbi:hypothetical protein [Ottowia thiooxydans]|nr:hypothetical protein [Ottowia thiooxydans]